MNINKVEEDILKPKIHESVFIAKGAHIYGDVEILEGSSIWFNAVIRGDEGKITIGRNTNIQDNTVIHSDMMVDVIIGNNVAIGHGAIIRGCTIGNNVMVGMNSTVMTYSEIGEFSIIGANSFIPYRKKFKPKSLIHGVPAKRIRELRDEELETSITTTEIYRGLIESYSNKAIRSFRD